ncbi:MAG: PilZ domain-containing protein [Venatoribacter sp.]
MSVSSRDYSEKRDFIRMQVSSPAVIALNDGSRYNLNCTDLSSTGAQLVASQPLPLNQTAQLTISSGGGSTRDLEAEVTICRVGQSEDGSYQIGVSIDKYL